MEDNKNQKKLNLAGSEDIVSDSSKNDFGEHKNEGVDSEKILKNLMCFLLLNKVVLSPVEESQGNIPKGVLSAKDNSKGKANNNRIFDFKGVGEKKRKVKRRKENIGMMKMPGGRRG